MPSDVPSDGALLTAATTGDTGAFDTFVLRHAGHVHRFLTSLGVDEADVDDVLQETFIAAWRGALGYRGDGSARSWLFTIARHAMHHAYRRRPGEPDRFAPLEAAETLDVMAVAAGWGSEAAAQARDSAELVRAALARLAPAEREILALRDIEGLSGEETAAALALTLSAMKSRLHRARLHLAAIVRTLEAGDAGPQPSHARVGRDGRDGREGREKTDV